MAALSAPGLAQSVASGSIAGVVKDDSGGVLPGVTVEAASPALIEKVRTAVTDAAGRVQDRRPAPRHVRRDVHACRASARSGAKASS